MATAAILGCAGYTGQETLDRVLAHPELEPVALGSDSLAGPAGASALDPRLNGDLPAFVTERRGARGRRGRRLPLPRARGGGRARAARRRGRRRPLRRAPAARRLALRGVVRLRASAPGARAGATALPELFPPERPLVANPGCYATAALLALAPLADAIDPTASSSTRSPASPAPAAALKASSHAGFVLENLTPYRVGDAPARAGDRAGARLPGLLRPAPAAGRRGLLATCYVQTDATICARCSRTRTPTSPAVRVLPEGVAPELSRVQAHGRRGDRALRGPRDGHDDRRLRDRQPRQGRSRPGRAERERRARPRRDRRAAADGSARMSVTAAQGLRRQRRALRASASAGPTSRSSLGDGACDRRGDVHREPRAGGAGRRLARSTSSARSRRPSSINSGQRERGDRRARASRDARATAAEAARLLGLDARAGARALDRRDRRAAAGRATCSPGSRRAVDALSPGRRRRRGRGDPDHRHVREGGGRARRRLHRRRDGEGLRDDPSRTSRRCSRSSRPTTRSSRARRSSFLRPAVERELQLDLRRRRVLDERRRRPARRTARAASARATTPRSPRRSHAVCAELARQIVADGEGATLVAAISVSGAATPTEAKAVARRIATSPLVKTALFGKRRELGARARRRRLGAVQRRLRAPRPEPA